MADPDVAETAAALAGVDPPSASADEHAAKPPPGVWMHKTRSKKAGEISVFASLKGASTSWNRRFVWIEGSTLIYGEKMGKADKKFEAKAMSNVQNASAKRLRNEGAPDVFVNFGWEFTTASQTTTFVCESIEARDVYVTYLSQFMPKKATPAPAESSTMLGAATTARFSERPEEMSIAAQAQHAQTEARFSPAAAGGAGGRRGDADDDGEGGIAAKSQRELRNLTGGYDEEEDMYDVDGEDYDEDDDDYDSEDDASSDDEGSSLRRNAQPKQETKAQLFERLLTPVASRPYLYIPNRHDAFLSELQKNGESDQDIVFSRALIKVAKRDNPHDREVVVTRRNLYLFAAARFSGLKTRVIGLEQVVGVLESTLEPTLFAILIPSFHDVLIRITPSKADGPPEIEVKKQMIAHIYKGATAVAQGREFLFREAENIKELIRRTEEDEHQPLESTAGDTAHASQNPKLYPTFRINAESKVYLSRHVERINSQHAHSPRLLIVTDGGVYLASMDGNKITVRESLAELNAVKFDVSNSLLMLVFAEYDTLLVVRNPSDFEEIREFLPAVAFELYKRRVDAVPAHGLKNSARLRDAKGLTDHLGGAGKGIAGAGRRGMKRTQRALLESLMSSAAKARELGQGIRAIGAGSVKVLKSGVCSVGGVLVDNAIATELLGAAQALGSHQRVLHEGCLTMRDEQALFRIPRGVCDTLQLNRSSAVAAAKVNHVLFSSRCKVYNITAHVETKRTSDLVVLVCDRGVYLFDDPTITDSGFLTSAIQRLRSDKGYNISEKIKWPAISGIARCTSEPNVLAVLTNDSRSSDLMVRVGNAALADKFVATFCVQFRQSEDHRSMTPKYYTTDTADSLRAALKKTTFDPDLIVALHRHRVSDSIGIAVVPSIVESVRRHGDNRVLFSGIAWRFRGSRVRKGAEKLEGILEKHAHSADSKKDFKSFILIITNCAVYHCQKGGFEIVRRTEIRSIKRVCTSTEDPDALLLEVPSEYDMFLRIEGRAKELIDRLQDSYAEWGTYNLYLPGEGKGSHDIADFSFPVVEKPSLVSEGNLERPANFKDIQARRNPADVKRKYMQWFEQDMLTVVDDTERIQNARTWPEEQAAHDIRIARLKHSLDRAFNFGLRAESCPPMRRLVQLLQEYEFREGVVNRLTNALETDDASMYSNALHDANKLREVGNVSKLIAEQSKAYAMLKDKAKILSDVHALLARDQMPPLKEFEQLFKSAELAHINEARIAAARRSLSARMQRERFNAVLRLRRQQLGQSLRSDERQLLASAAESVGVTRDTRSSIIENSDPMARWATTAVDSAIESGSVARLEEAVERVKTLEPRLVATLQDTALKEAAKEIALLKKHDDSIHELEQLCGELRLSMNRLEAVRLASSLQRLEKLETTLARGRSLQRHRGLCALYIDRVEERLGIVESKAARRDEEERAAAEYRERIRHKERERKEQEAVERRQRDEEDRRRRGKLAESWLEESDRLMYSMKQHVASEEFHATSNCVKACDQLAAHIVDFVSKLNHQGRGAEASSAAHSGHHSPAHQLTPTQEGSPDFPQSPSRTLAMDGDAAGDSAEGAGGGAAAVDEADSILMTKGHISLPVTGVSLDEKMSLQPELEKIIMRLRTARNVGALYLTRLRETKSRVLPPALLQQIRQLNKAAVVHYLDSRSGKGLTTEAVAEIRAEWLRAAKEQRWVQQLHSRIHQAVALKNEEALLQDLAIAKSRNYSDHVVASAREWLDARTGSPQRDGENDDGSDGSDNEMEDGEPSDAPQSPPSAPAKPSVIVYDMMHGWPPKAAKTPIVTTASACTKALVANPGNKINASDASKVDLFTSDENSPEVRQFLEAWHNLLAHRIKPRGIFRKTERTLVDVLAFVGELTRKGDIVCAFSNHLQSEFERVRKLNHSRGLSPSLVLVKFLVQKGDMLRFIDDILAMLPKEAEDIYFEDSVWRQPTDEERKDLRLMAKMLPQIEWPFNLEDRGDAALLRGGAAGGGAGAAGLDEAALLADGAKEQRTSLRAVQSLRRSVARLAQHFSSEMNRLSASAASASSPHSDATAGALSDQSPLSVSFDARGSAMRSPEALTAIFDENTNKTIGLLVRSSLCAALSSLLLVGYRSSHLFVKRHLWDVFKASAERLKKSARGFGAVALPDAVEMVENLTDTDNGSSRRGGASGLAGKSDAEINDIRVRMLYSHALNQQALASFILDAIFDEHPSNHEFLDKYYHVDKAVLLQPETREEVSLVLHRLSTLPFVISVDAELW